MNTTILALTLCLQSAPEDATVRLAWTFEGLEAAHVRFEHRIESRVAEATRLEPGESVLELSGRARLTVRREGAALRLVQRAESLDLSGRGGFEGKASLADGAWKEDLTFYSDLQRRAYDAAKAAGSLTVDVLDPSGRSRKPGAEKEVPYLWLHLPSRDLSAGDRWEYENGPYRASYRLRAVESMNGLRCAVIEANVASRTVHEEQNVRYSERQKGVYHFAIDMGFCLEASVEGTAESGMIDSPKPFRTVRGQTHVVVEVP
jgi:hypothetical protein